MNKCIFNDGTIIEDFGKPYFVAEVNSSHNGDVEVAKKMIDAAVEIGCDCVKFQSFSVDTLYSKSYYKENPVARRFVKKFAMSPESLKMMADYSRDRGTAFSSTPYSEEEVDFLIEKCRVPFVKIASMELNNSRFLKYIGGKNYPIVLSTGMGEFEEIKAAIDVLEEAGAEQITILHCVSVYPTPHEILNLNNILGLREKFSHPIGFSDHTLDDSSAVASIALGAALIEKHLTLDKNKIGMDNGMAMEPPDFKILVDKCKNIHSALGSKKRILQPQEYEYRKKMRRSITAAKDLKAGTFLKAEDLHAKRPGTGLAPNTIDSLIGKKVIRDVAADTLIFMEDLG